MTTEDARGDRSTSPGPATSAASPSGAAAGPVTAAPAAGWWPSPWGAAEVAGGKVSRGGLQAEDGVVYWTESRPGDGGRQVVVAVGGAEGAGTVDVSPPGVSVRSRVHEYGGGAAVASHGVLYYVDQDDQAWYRFEPGPGSTPVRLGGTTGASGLRGDVRHADGRPTPDGRWLISVAEDHGPDGTGHALEAVRLDGSGRAQVVARPGDFVAAPRPSPDGRWLAWVTWDHPDMPWDAGRLQVAPLSTPDGPPAVGEPVTLAGGPDVSVGQPRWTPDGALLFVDDRTGWWLPYRVAAAAFAGGTPGRDDAEALLDDEAEYHEPDWVFGQHTLDVLDDGSLVAVRRVGGRDALVVLRPPADDRAGSRWTRTVLDQPCVNITAAVAVRGDSSHVGAGAGAGASTGRVAVLGSTTTEAQAVFLVDVSAATAPRRLSAPPSVWVPPERASASVPRWGRPTRGQAQPVPGQFFAPVNPDVTPGDDPPPLVVFCHGGPTASAPAGYDPVVQFLTSRGIAVAAVDYRGSAGYGRTYRNLLRGAWGAGDVDDCVAYAESLAADGLVDGRRMAIRGTSAGGLTALAALVRARCFAGAVAWYGVTDLLALAADTHDFESRYTDSLVGPLPATAAVYRDRSPIHHAGDLVGEVLLLQGSEDPVVPLAQAERFAAELRDGGADCTLVVFEGESHGFRRAGTIEAALTEELDFYRALFAPDGTRGR